MTDISQESYHFGVVKRAIEMIDSAQSPLSLEDLAKQMDMSPAHFQRVFSRWAGVSPKRYQQYLTLDHAKALLRDRYTMLDTSDAIGLSGSGRLHDLFVRWEAMSPGDFARKGAGLVIHYGWFESPFGKCVAMGTQKGLCGMGFAEPGEEEGCLHDLTNRWPAADYEEAPARLKGWVDRAFGVSNCRDAAPLYLMGAPFQIKVWEALLHVRSGHVTTYSDIASAIGSPKAVRAVGTAVGRNPISWLIPCHRALRKSGALGGYHWGLPVKRAMLAYEAARFESDASVGN